MWCYLLTFFAAVAGASVDGQRATLLEFASATDCVKDYDGPVTCCTGWHSLAIPTCQLPGITCDPNLTIT